MLKRFLVTLMLAGFALAANPQDEQVVRTAYAKLAYAIQSQTVYKEAKRNPKLKPNELAQKLQASDLRFQISDMSSGMLSDILSRPYSDFVTPPTQITAMLSISLSPQTLDENGQRFSSMFAGTPHWGPGGGQSREDWNTPVQGVIELQKPLLGKFSRYVAASITVTALGKSENYRALWYFGPNEDPLGIDIVAGQIVKEFARLASYPSVLTDTHLRSIPAVQDWLNSNQRFEASCKRGKTDVCCDTSTMQCGVAVDDLNSSKPAPSTKPVPKEGL